MKTYYANSSSVKLLGRTHACGNTLWLALSGSGIEFTVTGKKLEIDLLGDKMADKTANDEDCTRIGIEVDGKRAQDFMMNVPQKCVSLTLEETDGCAVVRLIKLSESAMSTIGITQIRVEDGEIAPTPKKNLLVEVIGDSITCGYGVDDEDYNHNFKTSTEDVTKAYAYRTAKALNVDYSMVSFSGYGIISGYTDSGVINTKETLPQYYEKVGYCKTPSGTANDEFRVEDIAWDFSVRQPDLIVINLGTNDASYCGEDKERQAMYQKGYVQFLKKVRANNPKAPIVCALGIMGDVLYPSLVAAVSEYSAETGDVNLTTLHFDAIAEDEGYVADWHPTQVTHAKAAKKLTEKIRGILAGKDEVKLSKPVIALTFDDGPNTTTTDEVLDKIVKYGVPATFFLIGKNINEESEKVVKHACELGCEIENHSVTHSVMSEMPIEKVLEEIEENSKKITSITGRTPEFFRPPYIAVSQEMRERIELTMISGYGSEDWKDEVTSYMRAERILAQAEDGAILLLHDKEGNFRTVEALEEIIPALIEQGYHFVTVSGLFANKEIAPKRGVVYYNCLKEF